MQDDSKLIKSKREGEGGEAFRTEMWFSQLAIVRSAAHHIFSRHKYAIFDVHKFNQVFF